MDHETHAGKKPVKNPGEETGKAPEKAPGKAPKKAEKKAEKRAKKETTNARNRPHLTGDVASEKVDAFVPPPGKGASNHQRPPKLFTSPSFSDQTAPDTFSSDQPSSKPTSETPFVVASENSAPAVPSLPLAKGGPRSDFGGRPRGPDVLGMGGLKTDAVKQNIIKQGSSPTKGLNAWAPRTLDSHKPKHAQKTREDTPVAGAGTGTTHQALGKEGPNRPAGGMGLKKPFYLEGDAPEGAHLEGASRARCPLCRKDTTHSFRPFCSHKCKMVDLYRWVSGHYVIPGDPDSVLEKEKEEALEEWQEGGQDGPL